MRYHNLRRTLLLMVICQSSLVRAELSDIPLEAVQAGTFYARGILDGVVDTDLLLDTGSGYVSLSKRTLDQFKNDASVILMDEGVENSWARHAFQHRALAAGVAAGQSLLRKWFYAAG